MTQAHPFPIEWTSLEETGQVASACTRCRLSQGRTRVVFGSGNPHARLMLIGEAPGQTEDETGLPFVGRAGQLLTQIFESVNLDRERDVYICNIVKCRPPGNRKPEKDEAAACRPYLEAQLNFVNPQIILLAGATAVAGVLDRTDPMNKVRGRWIEWRGKKVMPIFHPSYLLRNQSKTVGSPKWHMWQDIQEVRKVFDQLSA